MFQWLRALTANPKDPSLSASSHLVIYKSSSRDPMFSSGQAPGSHAVDRHTCRLNIHTHKIRSFKNSYVCNSIKNKIG